MTALDQKHYVTPAGFSALQTELKALLKQERPKLVETIRWAASNGDRSENGDYIYGKKRLREIDRRVRYLTKRIENAAVIDPKTQQHQTKVFFGATVTIVRNDQQQLMIKIVGIDEADPKLHAISYISPMAKALLKAEVGDVIRLKTPEGIDELDILAIKYE